MNSNNITYLIPANAKRGNLILNVFTMFDLILFASGAGLTMVIVMAAPPSGLLQTVLVLSPALITGMLVTPIPNYHNVMTVLLGVIRFFSEQRNYKWKGWCINEYFGDKQK